MPEQLDHLILQRLKESETRRPERPAFGASPPLRSNQREHQGAIAMQMHAAVERPTRIRPSQVEVTNLLVLEMSFLGIDERQQLEDKFQAFIVSESNTEEADMGARYEISLHFSNSDYAHAFLEEWSRGPYTSMGFVVSPERASLGIPSDKKYVLSHPERSSLINLIEESFILQVEGLDIERVNSRKIRSSQKNLYKFIVQFTSLVDQQHFIDEANLYAQGNTQNSFLTAVQRANLFDALQSVRSLSPEDKMGPRLREKFDQIGEDTFFFDVDLWHPGENLNISQYKQSFRTIVQQLEGRVPGGPQEIAGSLLVAKVQGNRDLLSELLTLDMVSWIDLPPSVNFDSFTPIDDAIELPDLSQLSTTEMPLAAIIDSGIVSGHPFLSGLVVDAIDFSSGEGTPADLHGHGTQVAGVVVYGDLTEGLTTGKWEPKVRVLSGKVLRNNPDGTGGVIFAEDERASIQMADAIRTLHDTYGCRVFNLSINENHRVYRGGRQSEWALMLDDIARELNIVVVVSSGNAIPEIPSSFMRTELGRDLLEIQTSERHAIADPASGANVLTVGSIARRDEPSVHPNVFERDPSPIVPVESEMPSPFTRTGNVLDKGSGLVRQVKPELVSYGGNYSITSTGGVWARWKDNDRNLAEVLLNHNFPTGSLLTLGWGTSFAAPQVTHVCAQVEHQLRRIFHPMGKIPSANLVRAITVHSASIPQEIQVKLTNGLTEGAGQRRLRRFFGYGRPSIDKALFSDTNRVLLVADDLIASGKYHIYELELPENFVRNRGRRKIRATLAFDPPVRNTRKTYVARTMWMKMCRGLTPSEIDSIRSTGGSGSVAFGSNQLLNMKPTGELLSWSTVQSNIFETTRAQVLETCRHSDGKYKIHLIVGCEEEFPGYEEDLQRYGLVVSLEHEDAQISLYQEVQASITVQARAQMRSQSRVRSRSS